MTKYAILNIQVTNQEKLLSGERALAPYRMALQQGMSAAERVRDRAAFKWVRLDVLCGAAWARYTQYGMLDGGNRLSHSMEESDMDTANARRNEDMLRCKTCDTIFVMLEMWNFEIR